MVLAACGGSSEGAPEGASGASSSSGSSEVLGSCDLIDFDALSEIFGIELSVDDGDFQIPIPDSFPVSPSRSCTAYDAEGGAMLYIKAVPVSWEQESYSAWGKEEEFLPVGEKENVFFAPEADGLGFLSGKFVDGEYAFHIAGRLRDRTDDDSFGGGYKAADRDDLITASTQISENLSSYDVPEVQVAVDCDAELFKNVASAASDKVHEFVFWGAPACVAVAENDNRLHASVSKRDDAKQIFDELEEYYDFSASRPVPESISSDSFDSVYFIQEVQVNPLAKKSRVANELYAISGDTLVHVSAMGDEAIEFYDATQLEKVAQQVLAG